MWWLFHFALIQILTKWSLQNFAHGLTAVLSWHVSNFVAIWSPTTELQQKEISIEFEMWWKNRQRNGSLHHLPKSWINIERSLNAIPFYKYVYAWGRNMQTRVNARGSEVCSSEGGLAQWMSLRKAYESEWERERGLFNTGGELPSGIPLIWEHFMVSMCCASEAYFPWFSEW